MFGQLVVKLPEGIENHNIYLCIDMKKINDAQGRLYESLNIHMTQLAATFEKMVKHENSEKGPEKGQKTLQQTIETALLNSIFCNVNNPGIDKDINKKISWTRSTFLFFKTEFGSMTHWKAMLKLSLILLIIIGQETIWCFIYTQLKQPVLNYTDVGVIFEENGLPILTFVNSVLPDGTTSTTSFTDYFLEYANEEE